MASVRVRIRSYYENVPDRVVPLEQWLGIGSRSEDGYVYRVADVVEKVLLRLVEKGLVTVEEVVSWCGTGYGEWQVIEEKGNGD